MQQSSTLTNQEHVTLGNYEVHGRVASGGMGELFVGVEKGGSGFKQRVALKRLHRQYTSDANSVAMFVNEAKISAALLHPNIVQTYDLFEDESGAYVMAMDYVDGRSVHDLMKRGAQTKTRMPYGVAVGIIAAICNALHYAYYSPDPSGKPRKIIHRDISPSNLLVSQNGHVKLLDFGIAKALEADNITKVATLKGKFGYMSPEQCSCIPLDNRSDLFALGTVLWEISTGKRLFYRESDIGMLDAICRAPIPLPTAEDPNYPKALEHVVMKSLDRDREKRWETAEQFANALLALAKEQNWDTSSKAIANYLAETYPDARAIEPLSPAILNEFRTPTARGSSQLPVQSPQTGQFMAAAGQLEIPNSQRLTIPNSGSIVVASGMVPNTGRHSRPSTVAPTGQFQSGPQIAKAAAPDSLLSGGVLAMLGIVVALAVFVVILLVMR